MNELNFCLYRVCNILCFTKLYAINLNLLIFEKNIFLSHYFVILLSPDESLEPE